MEMYFYGAYIHSEAFVNNTFIFYLVGIPWGRSKKVISINEYFVLL